MISAKLGVDYSVFKTKMTALEKKLPPYIDVTMQRIAERGVELLSERTPRSDKGEKHMADMWKYRRSREARAVEYIISNLYPDQNIVLYMEMGTKPHEIRPRTKKCLAFTTMEGDFVRAKRVFHPGTKGHFMLGRTRRDLDILAGQYVKSTIQMVDSINKRGK